MSFNINSDKEFIRGSKPQLIGDNELTIRAGSGTLEREIIRTQLDTNTGLPRVGINRTGQRVNEVNITAGGSGYTTAPSVVIDPPSTPGGVQALASAFIFNGKVINIAINNPGNGYTTAPGVTISGGNGTGATADAVLDTVDFELDINGAIRTSTSIISDTARILNLDIDNVVTPDLVLRGPNFKTYMNGTGTLWDSNVIVQKDSYRYFGANVYQALETGTTSNDAPVHTDGVVNNGTVPFKHIGLRSNDQNAFAFGQTGEAGIFPRSITPLLGDRSDRIATTEYVLNLATNDVGGRIYVSEQIGSDLNDGRSAVNPVRTIKKAAQLAWATPGVKESIIVSGGDYLEDNPISLPPDCSIVGDNLRLVIIRPRNPGKHIVKFGDKNYVIGVTYRDQIDANGDPVATWDFAMVFDDKQRICIDKEANGDFGTAFPIGHQIFGPDRFRVNFQQNTGLQQLQTGLTVVGVNTGARAEVIDVTFTTTTGASAYIGGTLDVELTSGSFVEGEQFRYITSASAGSAITQFTITETSGQNTFRTTSDPSSYIPGGTYIYLDDIDDSSFSQGYYEVASITPDDENTPSYWDVQVVPILGSPTWSTTNSESILIYEASVVSYTFDSTSLKSIRAEGEVVSVDDDVTNTLPIQRIDFSLQGDPTIATGGFQNAQFGNAEDLGGIVFYTNDLVGRANTHDFKEGQEILIQGLPSGGGTDLSFLNGKQRIYKVLEDADGRARRFVIPKKSSINDANFDPGQNATVSTFSKSVTLSLLNSPNTFPLATPVERRFQDACTFIRNNREFIADEVVGRINSEFAQDHFAVYDISGNDLKIFLGTSRFEHIYDNTNPTGVVKFGGQSYNITDFLYDNTVTGVATITLQTMPAGIAEDSVVQLADIVFTCDNGTKTYPSFNIPNDDDQCREDVIHFCNAIVRDLEFGTNHNVIEAAQKYIVNGKITYIENEIIQNVRAVEYARQLCIHAMRNWRTENGTPSDPVYVPQYSSVTRYFDDTVITTTAGNPACADVKAAIDTLAFLWVDVITNNTSGTYLDAAYLIARNAELIADQALLDTEIAFPSLGLSDINQRKCRRDINIVLNGLVRDLCLGGNSGIVEVAEAYFTGTALTGVPEAQRPATLYAFQRVRQYAIYAMRNWTTGNTTETVTPLSANYNSTSGSLTITIADPVTIPVAGQDRIAFTEAAILFDCNSGTHGSPQPTDRNYGKSLDILTCSSAGGITTITCNVGDAGSAAGDAHTFNSAVADGTILITNPIVPSSPIPKFEDWNILLDPTAGTPIGSFTPTDASYDPSNGEFEITVGSGHGVTTGNVIRLAPESFTFTCAMDGNKSEHSLPEPDQPANGASLSVTGTTSTTIKVNVGASGPDLNMTPSAATYDPATGALELTIGAHTLSVGEGITIDDNSLSFTCDMDNNSSIKTYPRPGIDPFAGRSMKITGTTQTTITVNAGVSRPNQYFQPSAISYDASNGDMTVTVGQHGLGVGRNVVIEDNSLTFTCDQDGNQTQHTYPRSTDPASGSSLEITAVGFSAHTVTDADYTPATGNLELTIPNHGFANGDYIKVLNGTLLFTCDLDGNTVQKSYPRAGYDYPSGRWLEISNVTTSTFEINIGGSSYTGNHTFTGAISNGVHRQDGTFTVNVGNAGSAAGFNHTFVSATAQAIKHEPQSTHTFTGAASGCVKHLPQSAHTFVRTTTNSVTAYQAGQGPLCANVESTIATAMGLFEDILEGSTEPGATTVNTGTLFDPADIISYPDSYIYDQNNVRMAVRATYDDYPIIEASPYTQNSSVISFLGGSGALVDGSKVKQPNCPFPGLELDGTASFPNQGKSMVASAFTIVSFGGTGYKVIEDGYTQLVSVFVIFCADGVLAESGGYCSITNSATNFGIHALRGVGFRREAYSFDTGTITNVSSTPTGRAILTVDGLGREPLEHYVVKIDGYENTNEVEYFVDVVSDVGAGPPFQADLTIDDGQGQPMDLTDSATGLPVSTGVLTGKTIRLHRPSIVNSSSHTWEFAGSGTNYLALPENGGTKDEAEEQVSENYGRVYVSGTDELGDFKVGTFARIENRTGAITFTGTVTISEVEFLKLKGGDVVVTGFSADNTLGGAATSDSVLPTQKAVRDYITNNLGPFINKPYSTNAVPRALVELTDSGKISVDQIPALRPFEVYTVADEAARLNIEGALAGDIAIQQDTNGSFILNNDLTSQFLAFQPDPTIQFTLNDIFTGSVSTGRVQATEYRTGVVYSLSLTNGGSGYTQPPTVTIAGTLGQGGVEARAECTIANGEVVTITLVEYNGFVGGKGYTSAPTVTIAAPPGAGTQAQANALLESRLYGNIVNLIQIEDTDTIESSDVPSVTVNLTRVVNTSASTASNWVSLSSNQIAASDITTGVLETDRLALGGAANSFTFLRGDSNFALAVQSIKGAEIRYFAQLYSNASAGSSQLVFTTNSDFLNGHEVVASVLGIQQNTNITGVLTSAGLTTISLNNPLTQTISSGTILEFERGASPMVFESSYTQGNFVDDVIIANGGSGFTNGQYFDQPLDGGTGTGLKATITVSGNAITALTVTDGGTGYNNDFSIITPPTDIGAGSSMVLEAKVSTVNRQYANVALDVARVTELTISSDLYGTIGVSRFKKDQFNIGTAGNGSIELKTGPGSGLDADLLDTKQGSFYTNATNLFSGTVPTDRLAGSYNISVSGSSGNTLRLATGTNNPTSNPSPNNFVEGLVANTINNSADGLNDGGSQHLVLTIRNKGQGLTAEGGVRQMAFTDNDNIYLRGSGTGVTTFGTWAKLWTSLNDGPGSGLDADRLANKQASWYRNALNINYGVLSDNRIPGFLQSTKFRDEIVVQSYNGDPKYQVYISGQILNTTPFTPGNAVNLYNALSQAVGRIEIDNIIINDDLDDNFNDYTIIVGRLTSGDFTAQGGAETIGSASNKIPFDEYSLDDGNVVEVATLESDGGTANLKLGRRDGQASSPGVYFSSSQLVANYNTAIVATGGNATDGSGTLNALVVNADGFNINGNVIWNAGNIQFQSSNVVDTAVRRDGSGNFSAGTITANLTGAASENVLKTGDTMTGTLNISGTGSNLTVSGTSLLTGVVTVSNDLNVDNGVLFVDVSSNEVGINAGNNPLSTLDVVGDAGIFVRTSTNAVGAKIRFCDIAGNQSQTGTIRYNHSDGQSPNSQYGETFTMEGTESTLAFRVVGDIISSRNIGININRQPNYNLEVDGTGFFSGNLTIQNGGAGQFNFYNNSGTRYWRVGSNTNTSNVFSFEASDSNGSTAFTGAPTLSLHGATNAVTINTTATSGTDPTDGSTVRNYKFNVQGDMNINGQLFQDNAEFVTSRWTEATNGNDIYRLSKVGINKADPQYTLDLDGDFNLTGIQYINGNAQWLDANGIIKIVQNADIAENINITNSTDCFSDGPIVIANGYTVDIGSGSSWSIR